MTIPIVRGASCVPGEFSNVKPRFSTIHAVSPPLGLLHTYFVPHVEIIIMLIAIDSLGEWWSWFRICHRHQVQGLLE